MSPLLIGGLVGIMLLTMVAVGITMQTVEKNNKEKRRLEAALATRARNFSHMLQGFPEGFLSRDLRLLVCQCLLEVFEQQSKLSPKSSEHSKNKQRTLNDIKTIEASADGAKNVRLTDAAQIKETQQLLKNLYGFIGKLKASKRITEAQAQGYSQQVRDLTLKTSLDTLHNGIDQAMAKDKPKLALHYLEMSIDKMSKANNGGRYSDKIANCQQQMQALNVEAEAQDERRQEADEFWEEPVKDDEWKKKALYD